MDTESLSPCDICKEVAEWIIRKMVKQGTCTAGLEALAAISAAADALFADTDEILIPLEDAIGDAWTVTCGEVGIAVLGKEADKYALEWCKKATIPITGKHICP